MSSKKSSDGTKREAAVSGMSFLRGSPNYVWCTTSVLGKGATGAVFQGVNRHTGEAVAVKTFNQMSHMRPPEVQMREFEVLKRVNHRNIVQLLAIEEEQDSRGKVIVMELCTGGSLFNILDDPENSYGLEEGEFLLVLHHLSSGMKHLRDNHLVHRDLKPGNIMKFVGLDGSTLYKLTDFGAARELEDDQQFMSLYGTEEYLHPDMYERAVLRKPIAGKSFGANVDLWSIGVTLYHVATGLLPFRPHGGRRNRETMHIITTKKEPGVISGVQTSDDGPIDYSKELPATCQLSLGLRRLVTPLLGGLLEVNPERMWKFERFFSEVTALLARKRIHVFHVNRVQPLTVYMQSDHRYEQLQQLVQDQADVSPQHQLLLYRDATFSAALHNPDTSPASSYPATTRHAPVMLFSSHDHDVTLTLPETPSLKFPSFPNNVVSVDQDALTGKSLCSAGHAVSRLVQHQATCVALVHQAVDTFRSVLVSEVQQTSATCEQLRQSTQAASDSFTQLVTHHRRFLAACLVACPATSPPSAAPTSAGDTEVTMADQESFMHFDGVINTTSVAGGVEGKGGVDITSSCTTALRDQLEDLINNIVDEEKKVRTSMDSISSVVEQLYHRLVECSHLQLTWQQHLATINSSCNITTNSKTGKAGVTPVPATAGSLTPASMQGAACGGETAVDAMARTPAIASALVTKLKDSWQHLLRDRAARALTFNDEQFHLLEKLKMKETSKGVECLLGCCTTTLNAATDGLADWCKVAQVQRVQADIARCDLRRHEDRLQALQRRLRDAQDSYHTFAGKLLHAVQRANIHTQSLPAPDVTSVSGAAAVSNGGTAVSATVTTPTDVASTTGTTNSSNASRQHRIDEAQHRVAIVRNLQRVSEKQEATLRLLDEARTIIAHFRRSVPLADQY